MVGAKDPAQAGRPGLKAPFLASAFLLGAEGWEPVAPAFGTTVIQIGPGVTRCPVSGFSHLAQGSTTRAYRRSVGGTAATAPLGPAYSELSAYSGAVLVARRRALADAVAQAAKCGAHGAVGLASTWAELGPGVHQASWQGQALRHPGSPPLARPFSATLGAAALAKLLQCGYVPVTVVVGFAAVHVHAWATRAYGTGSLKANYELPTLSQAFSTARHIALRALQDDTVATGAEVVVGLELSLTMHPTGCAAGEGARLATAVALGTAAVRFGAPLQRRPDPVISLAGEGRTS